MNYINQFKLIQAMVAHQGGRLDYKELLPTVNRHHIMKSIEKTNPELSGIDSFFITEETMEEENWSKLPKKEKRAISRLNEKIKKSEDLETVIKDLGNYRLKYPDVPVICNYLAIAYERADQLKKYLEVLFETRKKYPDYIFGKISLAEYYLSIKRFRKIPDVLDNKFEITQHFPVGTEIFHISVVRSFYYITGRYFAKAGKIELAYKAYFLLSELDINHLTTEILGQDIIASELIGLRRKMSRK
jgi:tetratricopeptide (TPR) repeat protein